ncbi:MAG: hypothetical protein RL071_3265 [Pseudomonadota bacterium]
MPSPRDQVSLLVRATLAGKMGLLAAAGAALLLCGGSFVGLAAGAVAWTDSQWRGVLAAVVDAPADTVDPTRDGALIRVVAQATADAPARDEAFAVQRPHAVALVRVVETFQWVEVTETHRSGSGRSARRTHTKAYHQDWSQDLIDTRGFEQPEGHENPTRIPHDGRVVLGDGARLGAYALTEEVIEALPPLDPVPLTEGDADAAGGRLLDGHIHLHATPHRPGIGDQRVSYRALTPRMLTVMAMQDGGQLRPWPQPPAAPVLLAQPGEVSASALVWAERRASFQTGGMMAVIGAFICAVAALPLGLAGVLALIIPLVKRVTGRTAHADPEGPLG